MIVRRATRYAALLAMIIGVANCAQTGMSRGMRATIPVNANFVNLHSNLAPAAMYDTAQRFLNAQGFKIAEHDDSALKLTTGSKKVGTSRSEIRVVMEVSSEGSGSVLRASGTYPATTTDWLALALRGDDKHASEGFEELVMLVGQLPHREIRYESK